MGYLSLAERLGHGFVAETLHRDFLHVPGAVPDPGALVSYDTLNDLIATHRLEVPRLRLSADGEMLPMRRYAEPVITRRRTVWQRTLPADLHARLAEGASLVVDAIDHLHPPLGALAQELESWLRTNVQINAYASWTANEGFGIHWDDHDVLVVQVSGAKRWRLYGTTRTAPLHRDVATPEPPPEEPVADLVLQAGDLLYLPRGWWHAVTADQGTPSLHVTCGLTPHTGATLVGWLADHLREHEVIRADLPVLAPADDQAAHLEDLRKVMAAALDDPGLLTAFLAARDAESEGRLRPSLPHLVDVPADPDLAVRLTAGRARLLDAQTPDGTPVVRLVAAGAEIDLAPAARPLLAVLLDGQWARLGALAESTKLTVSDVAGVVGELVAAQAATVRAGER